MELAPRFYLSNIIFYFCTIFPANKQKICNMPTFQKTLFESYSLHFKLQKSGRSMTTSKRPHENQVWLEPLIKKFLHGFRCLQGLLFIIQGIRHPLQAHFSLRSLDLRRVLPRTHLYMIPFFSKISISLYFARYRQCIFMIMPPMLCAFVI
jgi:hypothetical protein